MNRIAPEEEIPRSSGSTMFLEPPTVYYCFTYHIGFYIIYCFYFDMYYCWRRCFIIALCILFSWSWDGTYFISVCWICFWIYLYINCKSRKNSTKTYIWYISRSSIRKICKTLSVLSINLLTFLLTYWIYGFIRRFSNSNNSRIITKCTSFSHKSSFYNVRLFSLNIPMCIFKTTNCSSI